MFVFIPGPPMPENFTFDVGEIAPKNSYVFTPDSSVEGSALAINVYLSAIIGAITTIAGIALLLYFFIGAFQWLVSRGDSDALEKARAQMLNAILGFVLVVVAWFFVKLIGDILGMDVTNPIWYIIQGTGSSSVLAPVSPG